MNQEAINRDLSENDSQSSKFQQKVVKLVRQYMKTSADRMSSLHTTWDNNAYIYRGYRIQDKEDKDAIKDGEPPKVIVPITYAQIQTAVSFILSTYTQKDNIFELRGTGGEDEKYSFPMSTDLQYQLNQQKFILKLYLWLLDAFKQGVGIMRVDWEERYNKMRVSKQQPVGGVINGLKTIFGRTPAMESVEALEEVLCYQGNKLTNISPYAFYPDPSVNVAQFQDGMFVGHEDETTLTALKMQEGKVYFGTDRIPESLNKDLFSERPRRITGPFNDEAASKPGTEKNGPKKVIRLEMVITMSEEEASKQFETKIGNGKDPVKWMVVVANDQKLIRFERVGSLQDRFNYELFEFSPDHDAFFNPGLADTISELQNITTFFLNSHIVNVRKIIANRFIVDPQKVMMEDIKAGSIFIRTNGPQGDVNRVIKQLDASDITRTHIQDMGTLMSLVQVITGVNENALGQYSDGRRSATEARNVNAGAAARLKMHASLAWLQGIEPLGRHMLGNTRQWRSKDVYNMIVGEQKALECPYEKVILADPNKLAGGYDFVPYDATLPTDRQFQAQVLTELFTTLVQNPDTIQLLNKNPIKLLDHIAQLYNIRNLRDFDLQPLPPGASQDGQPVPGLPPAPTASVVPNQQAADVAGAGADQVDFNGEQLLRSLAQ